MIKRSFDHHFIEEIITHPSVINGAKGFKGIDLQPIVENLNNYLLVSEYGGFILINKMPSVYEGHAQFLPEGRGAPVREAAVEAMDYMFINTDCERVISKTYKDNPLAVKLSQDLFCEQGETEEFIYFSFSYEDWVKRVTNTPDEAYYMSNFVRMAKAGHPAKAQRLYNLWAVMSGNEMILILREAPLVIQKGNRRFDISEEIDSWL